MCAPDDDARAKHLDRLRVELDARRVQSELLTSGYRPRLKLETPFLWCGIEEAEFEDNILAAPDGDGRWCYWWPWIENIGPVDDVLAVADLIARSISAVTPGDDDDDDPGDDDTGDRECARAVATCH